MSCQQKDCSGGNALITYASTFLLIIASSLLAFDRLSISKTNNSAQLEKLFGRLDELQRRNDELTEIVYESVLQNSDAPPPPRRDLQVFSSTCTCTLPDSYTYASDYGLVGDGQSDDGPALQAAIDAASSSISGGIVLLPHGTFRINSPLLVPGGVTVQGMGYGSSPLAIQFDAGASTIAYCGTDYAVKLTGHSASLRDLAVYDWNYGGCEHTHAAGGVLIKADQSLVESVTVSNILIYFFTEGTALSLTAINGGGIPYANFQNVRIRHAKTGILLSADSTSFVNSNSFIGGAISGDITEAGLQAEGPGSCNDNKFYGIVIEPPETNLAHVYVTGAKTNVKLLDVRLEGTNMFSNNKPLVIIDDSSYGNVMTGMLGHTHIQANLSRNPEIDFMSAKMVGVDAAPMNLFWNAAFHGWDATSRLLPGWALKGTNANISVLGEAEMRFPDHAVISVDYLNYGGDFRLQPSAPPKATGHDFVTFGIYARSSVAGSISAAMRYESGSIIASASHSGSGNWEFIGMSALYKKVDPYFYFSITGDVDLTAPTFTFGQSPATPGASLMSSSGAKMSGTLSMGVATAPLPPAPTPYFWKLPKNEGNLFIMDMQGDPNRHIHRINDVGVDRFPRGTVITLLFSLAGTTVKHSAYIQLKNNVNFVSVPNSSITLMSNGDPTWVEISRNI